MKNEAVRMPDLCPICLIAQKMGKKHFPVSTYWCALYRAPISYQAPCLPRMKTEMGKKQVRHAN